MVSEAGRFHATIPPQRKSRPERNRLRLAVWIVIAVSLALPIIEYAAPIVRMHIALN